MIFFILYDIRDAKGVAGDLTLSELSLFLMFTNLISIFIMYEEEILSNVKYSLLTHYFMAISRIIDFPLHCFKMKL